MIRGTLYSALMWIMTTVGFFSVVQKEGANHLTVRSRVAADLDQLRARYLPELSPTTATPGNDYRYRATVSHAAFGEAMSRIVANVTYSNFKSEVEHVQGLERELVYAKVWTVLHQGLPPLDKPSAAPKAKGHGHAAGATSRAAKYGGVVFDDAGRILLREPTNHFDGYVWTFAKGAPASGETPEQTALREVREETGVDAEIVGKVPGVFWGGAGEGMYFVMRKVAEAPLDADARRETSQIRWATEHEARGMIGQTTNAKGRARDLAVLAAAIEARGLK